MEGATDLNDSLENAACPPHMKRKENDQPPQQPENCNVALENPTPIISTEAGWAEQLSMETLAGEEVNTSQSGSEALCTNARLPDNPGMMVEELTLKNYKSSHLAMGGCSSSGDSPRKGFWQNFRNIAGGSRDAVCRESLVMGDVADTNCLFRPQFWAPRPRPFLQSDNYHSKVSDHISESERNVASANIRLPSGVRTKILSSPGFPQFLVKSNLKGKGVAHKHQGIPDSPGSVIQDNNEKQAGNLEKASDTLQKPITKSDDASLLRGGDLGTSCLQNDGINLREWLKVRRQKLNKAEMLHIFKQILELVDISHSQGQYLQHLRPSYFTILPSSQVKYAGSFRSNYQMELPSDPVDQDVHYLENNLKRKRFSEQTWDKHEVSPKYLRQSKHSYIAMQQYSVGALGGASRGDHVQGSDTGSFRPGNSGCDFREQIKFGELYKSQTIPSNSTVSSGVLRKSISEIVKLEDRWYASPEELNKNTCVFASNIYSLGVLLFELFCIFASWEAHSSAMSDLRLRILPPNFLSESPKEAGFCLWLLHPEPSSRPKSRDILLSDLISEGRDLSSLDHSSASIDEEDAEAELLLHFLLILKEQNEKQAEKLVSDIGCLTSDIEEVERRQLARLTPLAVAGNPQANVGDNLDVHPWEGNLETASRLCMPSMGEERLMRNMDQLENAYFSIRANVELSETNVATRADTDVLKIRDKWSRFPNDDDVRNPSQESSDRLGAFFDGLCKYARYSKFEVRGCLRNVDILSSANVICSLSFDRDEDFFAAAGVSKKIKIFEFDALLNDNVDIHYPVIEMSSRSKLSCVCWNSYIKNYLASTDYEGVIQLWDASTGQGFTQYVEHQKRAWSVDFSPVDPTKLASGSDDCSVKLWSINEKNCINTIRNVANVCCVQFSSHSSHLLAFGSADYKIYCYDLRNTRIPWCTLAGHGKAVSYVKFADPETLVSASTDNSLKLWDLNKTNATGLSTSACSMSLTGHVNEKNFVGLSVCDGYIACGSESNEVYSYYKTLPMPVTSHKFGSIDPITGQETGDDNGQFVSSVCWRGKSSMVVAANSSGSIKLLQMV